MLNSLQRVVSHKHCPLVASAAAVGTIGLMVKSYDSKPKPAPQLSVMTFNVLARPYTKYNRDFHRAETKTESETQTRPPRCVWAVLLLAAARPIRHRTVPGPTAAPPR